MDYVASVAGTWLKDGMYTPLSGPVEAWHFDLRTPPEDSERNSLDLHFHTDGRMNAVVFWFRLQLVDGLQFSTGPEAVAAGEAPSELRPLQSSNNAKSASTPQGHAYEQCCVHAGSAKFVGFLAAPVPMRPPMRPC